MSLPAQYLSERTRLGSICGKQTSASNLLGQKNSIFSQHAKHFMNEIKRHYSFNTPFKMCFGAALFPTWVVGFFLKMLLGAIAMWFTVQRKIIRNQKIPSLPPAPARKV